MPGRGRGGGITPERVITLLKQAVAESSQVSVANATGLTRLTVQRYLKGIGEPSQATLEKLAAFFNVTVTYLRGESSAIRTRELVDNFEIPGRVEEIEQWIEEDEERRNWPDEQKADVICGLSLVEKVLKDEEISEYAIDYMKRRMKLLGMVEHEDESEAEKEKALQSRIEQAETKALSEGWSESELEWVKALLRKHRDSIYDCELDDGFVMQISRRGISFTSGPHATPEDDKENPHKHKEMPDSEEIRPKETAPK